MLSESVFGALNISAGFLIVKWITDPHVEGNAKKGLWQSQLVLYIILINLFANK